MTLNVPQRGNAYTDQMGQELSESLDEGEAHPDIRAIVVTGADRHFCVGVDLSDGANNRFAWLRAGELDKVVEEAEHEKLRLWGCRPRSSRRSTAPPSASA